MFFYGFDQESDLIKLQDIIQNESEVYKEKIIDHVKAGDTDSFTLFEDENNVVAFLWLENNCLEWLSINQTEQDNLIAEKLFQFAVKEATIHNYTSLLVNQHIPCLASLIGEYGENYNKEYVRIHI
jgi:hypothetical protein